MGAIENKGNGKRLDWMRTLIKRAFWLGRKERMFENSYLWGMDGKGEEKLAMDTQVLARERRNEAKFSSVQQESTGPVTCEH